MNKQKSDLREKIIETTIGLIKEHGDTSLITVREIASRVGVGIGLINYHFQTKDNLINICMLDMIGSSISQLLSANQNVDMKPIDKLFEISKGIAGFMVINPGLSKISITNDFNVPNENDNTALLTKMLLPMIKELYDKNKSESEMLFLLHMYITSMEAAFLRRAVLKKYTGFDFEDSQQRDNFIRFCMNKIFIE